MYDFSILDVKITAGSSQNSASVVLEPGQVIKLASFEVGTKPTENVDMKITTGRGDVIHPQVPVQEFFPRGGGSFMDCTKDISISGKQEIKIFLTATGNLANDYTIRTILYHQKQI